MTGSTTSHLALYLNNFSKKTMNDTVNLSTVLTKYYKFADVFSKTRAKTLAPYHPYNLQIKLENGKKSSTCLQPPSKKYSRNSLVKILILGLYTLLSPLTKHLYSL